MKQINPLGYIALVAVRLSDTIVILNLSPDEASESFIIFICLAHSGSL